MENKQPTRKNRFVVYLSDAELDAINASAISAHVRSGPYARQLIMKGVNDNG
jgi:hypothetical protein